jgi:hypothetical protein
LFAGSAPLALAQSTTNSRPTPVTGSGNGSIVAEETGLSKTCNYSGDFYLSDKKRKFEQLHRGLVFRKGSVQMFITAINNEGTNVSGSAYVEQTDAGKFNRNLVLPTNGLGGSIVTPLENKPIRGVQYISGKGKGYLRIIFGQNGNGMPKTGRYQLVMKGDAIVSCGSSSR